MRIGGMWFFECFPVFPVAASTMKLARALNNQLPSREEAMRALSAARSFIEYLRELVSPRVVEQLGMLAAAQPLGYNETKGVYGVPFGDCTALAFFTHQHDGEGARPAEEPFLP
jgi:hypothetical protein